MIPHRPSPNQPKNVTHTNFQVNPSIIRVHRRMQAEIQVFEPLTVVMNTNDMNGRSPVPGICK